MRVAPEESDHAILCVDPAGALWSWNGKWKRLPAARHPAIPDPVAVYDAKHGQLVLYGSGQTWTWDSSSGWNLRSGVGSTASPGVLATASGSSRALSPAAGAGARSIAIDAA